MKFSKKITPILLLGIIVSSNVLLNGVNSFANTSDKTDIISNTYNKTVKDIVDSKEYKSIMKIKLDSSGKPVSSEFLDPKQYKSGLSDGIYTIDRGDGWVLGKDKGFIKSMIVPKDSLGILSTNKSIEYRQSMNINASVSFGTDFIKSTLKAGYGSSYGESKNEEIYKSIKAPSDKNLFVKVQGVYRNVEVIKVKSGQIIDSANTFTPTAHTFTSLEFEDNENVNQSKLYERVDRCILGNPGYEIKNIRDQNANYHSKVLGVDNVNSGYYTLDATKQNKPFGLYFTVPESRNYEIKDIVFMDNFNYKDKGFGVGMRLYKVDRYNDNDIELMASVPANFKTTDFTPNNFNGQGITANLKTGEKYLLMLNEDMRTFWPMYKDKNINYRIQFNKK